MQDVPELVDGELRIDRYVVDAKLGEGGMADVWLCRMSGARGFSKRVVIKTIKPACRNEHYESMFIDEATIGARLEHPNIPRVTELGQTDSGALFLVQEYVDGPSVQQILQAQKAMRRTDLRLTTKIASSVAYALDFAYRLTDEQGRPLEVIHRDVSSTNILVSRKGSAKLIDFGVARFTDRETETQTGILKGKLRFMAPEIVSGGNASHQSDLYSLGQVLYRLTVGTRPGGVVGSPEFVVPSEMNPDIDPALDAIILAALQVKPANRVAHGERLAQRLDRWALAHGGPVTDAECAARLSAMFPGGATDWQPAGPDTLTESLRSLTPAPKQRSAPVPPPRGAGGLLVGAVAGLLAMGAAGAGGAWVATRAAPSMVPEPQEATIENLLDSAEVALAAGRLADAESLWREATRIETQSEALLTRRAELTTEVRLQLRLRDIRALALDSLDDALLQAQRLQREHPERADVAALLEVLSGAPTEAPPGD